MTTVSCWSSNVVHGQRQSWKCCIYITVLQHCWRHHVRETTEIYVGTSTVRFAVVMQQCPISGVRHASNSASGLSDRCLCTFSCKVAPKPVPSQNLNIISPLWDVICVASCQRCRSAWHRVAWHRAPEIHPFEPAYPCQTAPGCPHEISPWPESGDPLPPSSGCRALLRRSWQVAVLTLALTAAAVAAALVSAAVTV